MHQSIKIIKARLDELKITYSQLSDLTGIDESKIKKLITGRISLTLDDRDKFFKVIGDIDDKSEDTWTPPLTVMAIAELYAKLSDKKKWLISELILEFTDNTNKD